MEETELCEALCILLATNSRLSMQNTQIDFLSRVSKGRGLTVENIPALVSNSEFQRRYTVAVGGLADRLFFNFKRRDQSVLNELAAAMGIDLEKHRTKTGALSFRSAEMKKLMQALTYRITQRTVDDTLRQLRDNIRVGKHNNEMLQPLLTELEAALKGQAYTASGKLRKITMGELFNTIYSYLAGQAQAQFLEVFSQQTTINLTDTLRT